MATDEPLKKNAQKKGNRSFRYPAMSFAQRSARAPKIVLLHAPVKDVLRWATVDKLGPRSSGPQREQREAKVTAIAKFLSTDPRNIIPTAIVLAFREGAAKFVRNLGDRDIGELTIRNNSDLAATVVDGQHRLFGIAQYDEKIQVAIVGLLDTTDVERAFQFLVINNKSSRVAAAHTKALIAKMKSSDLAARLTAARVALDVEGVKDVDVVNTDKESPFYKTIDWPTTPPNKRMIQATAIELSLDYLGGLGIMEFDDRDVRRSVFQTIWSRIKEEWPDCWVEGNKLISKVGIICLTRFIADRITNWADSDDIDIEITDLDQIEQQTGKIIKYMDQRFWAAPWAEKAAGGFDTNQGRERVVAAIRQLYRNGRSKLDWYTDIDIIDRIAEEE